MRPSVVAAVTARSSSRGRSAIEPAMLAMHTATVPACTTSRNTLSTWSVPSMSTSRTRGPVAMVGESPAVCTSVRNPPSSRTVATRPSTDARSDTSSCCPVTAKPSPVSSSTHRAELGCVEVGEHEVAPHAEPRAHATPIPPTPVTTTTSTLALPRRNVVRPYDTGRCDRVDRPGRVSGCPLHVVRGGSSSLRRLALLGLAVVATGGAARRPPAPIATSNARARRVREGRRRTDRDLGGGATGLPSPRSSHRGSGRHHDEGAVTSPTRCDSPAWPRRSAVPPRSRRWPTASWRSTTPSGRSCRASRRHGPTSTLAQLLQHTAACPTSARATVSGGPRWRR